MKFALLVLSSIGMLLPRHASTHMIAIENQTGKNVEFGIDGNDRFLDVLGQIQSYLSENQTINDDEPEASTYGLGRWCAHDLEWNLIVSNDTIIARAKENHGRSYERDVSREQKGHISFIVKTLAFDNIITIGKKKSELKSRGDQIKGVHPLCFLKYAFSNEELKVGIAAISGRISWIRDGFFDGIYESLDDETTNKNLMQFLPEFSSILGIDENLIKPYAEKRQWKDFIKFLIDNIPRENDPNRYNM